MSRRQSSLGARAQNFAAGRLAAALIAAQAELLPPPKNRSVSVRAGRENYDFDYASLDTIIEHSLRPVLPRYGLWFVQFMKASETERWMVTQIIHASGETKDCPLLMPPLADHPQEAGSLISYFKRYALCAAFGLTAENDDDGNIASRHEMQDVSKQARISAEQILELEALAADRGSDLRGFCRYLKVTDLSGLAENQFERAKAILRIRRAA
jgi:hypothetical protein